MFSCSNGISCTNCTKPVVNVILNSGWPRQASPIIRASWSRDCLLFSCDVWLRDDFQSKNTLFSWLVSWFRHKVFIPMYKLGLTCTKFVQFRHLLGFVKLTPHKTLKFTSDPAPTSNLRMFFPHSGGGHFLPSLGNISRIWGLWKASVLSIKQPLVYGTTRM